jgi:hypothetical protein
MAYFSGHTKRKWLYGSYFGIRERWRKYNRADAFLYHLLEHFKTILPVAQGIVFETEPIDMPFLQSVADRSVLGRQADHRRIVNNLRTARRLRFYESNHCLTVLDKNSQPLNYRHPAMNLPLDESQEREQVIMVYFFDHREKDAVLTNAVASTRCVDSIMNFIYNDVYGDSYGEHTHTRLPGYGAYLTAHKAKVFRSRGGWFLGSWDSRSDNRGLLKELLKRAKTEGWAEEIDL